LEHPKIELSSYLIPIKIGRRRQINIALNTREAPN
jgi:hypothetical protein